MEIYSLYNLKLEGQTCMLYLITDVEGDLRHPTILGY